MEEGGQTALGPALLIAVTMACKVTGSKVIMCTDGLANVGLGSLDGLSGEEYKSASAFYTGLGETAKVNGYSFTTVFEFHFTLISTSAVMSLCLKIL